MKKPDNPLLLPLVMVCIFLVCAMSASAVLKLKVVVLEAQVADYKAAHDLLSDYFGTLQARCESAIRTVGNLCVLLLEGGQAGQDAIEPLTRAMDEGLKEDIKEVLS